LRKPTTGRSSKAPICYTAVYFREEYDKLDAFIKLVQKLKKPVSVYIFSWEDDPFIADFDDNGNITIKTIPQPIVEMYKQILQPDMNLNPLKFQRDGVDALTARFLALWKKNGRQLPLVFKAPTGSGKTYVAALFVRGLTIFLNGRR